VGKTRVVKEESTGAKQPDFSTEKILRQGEMVLPKSVAIM
jgi:hypothetical protein